MIHSCSASSRMSVLRATAHHLPVVDLGVLDRALLGGVERLDRPAVQAVLVTEPVPRTLALAALALLPVSHQLATSVVICARRFG
ncbi:hypothetical protein Henu3_gp26 [Mycobacterium phage Henu3]|uniref:Uncharacterized protein n=1 Tax=Mycobacterium phage Henu3 TaxID=2492961 RepID=A0A410T7U4_9CAUD|nr:hypothetical protein I5G68_gp23 [Mycobacterium phage Henu3]QAU04970.1 hypothetical protein Henu3_gp26 [Mycobacterium phage Henu3]